MGTTAYEPLESPVWPFPADCPICGARDDCGGLSRDTFNRLQPWVRYECGGAYVFRPGSDPDEKIWIGACGRDPDPDETGDDNTGFLIGVVQAGRSYLDRQDFEDDTDFEGVRAELYAACDDAINMERARVRDAADYANEVRKTPLR